MACWRLVRGRSPAGVPQSWLSSSSRSACLPHLDTALLGRCCSALMPPPASPSWPALRVELTLRQRKVGPNLESLEEGQVGLLGSATSMLMLILLEEGQAGSWGECPAQPPATAAAANRRRMNCNSHSWCVLGRHVALADGILQLMPTALLCWPPFPQVVRGTVKQVAKYGVFVQLEGSPGVTGGWEPLRGCTRRHVRFASPPLCGCDRQSCAAVHSERSSVPGAPVGTTRTTFLAPRRPGFISTWTLCTRRPGARERAGGRLCEGPRRAVQSRPA